MTTESVAGFRLVKKKWTASAFDGEGAKRYGGRWNSRGRRCVYLASSESLAILEVMVHLHDYRLLAHFALFQLRIPVANIMHLREKDLPDNWREDPAPQETAAIGDQWLAGRSSLALAVPSVIVPRDLIYLVNPDHADFGALVKRSRPMDFLPDTRLHENMRSKGL